MFTIRKKKKVVVEARPKEELKERNFIVTAVDGNTSIIRADEYIRYNEGDLKFLLKGKRVAIFPKGWRSVCEQENWGAK